MVTKPSEEADGVMLGADDGVEGWMEGAVGAVEEEEIVGGAVASAEGGLLELRSWESSEPERLRWRR